MLRSRVVKLCELTERRTAPGAQPLSAHVQSVAGGQSALRKRVEDAELRNGGSHLRAQVFVALRQVEHIRVRERRQIVKGAQVVGQRAAERAAVAREPRPTHVQRQALLVRTTRVQRER